MSQENVEIDQAVIAAVNRADWDATHRRLLGESVGPEPASYVNLADFAWGATCEILTACWPTSCP